ncbi:MAG: hypoxanthine phosphoribosyltransferase [Planctomycetota bacterium]
MHRDLDRILIDRDRIAGRVGELGDRIARDIEAASARADRLVVVPIMTGAMVFTADLIRRLPLRLSIELVEASSYPGRSTSSAGVTLRGEGPEDLSGAFVLVVDDIYDSGRTLARVGELLRARGPAELRTCVLLSKRVERAVEATPDYVGFDIPDEFVVGCGLDFDGYYRNLPDIATLKPEVVDGVG